MGKLSGNWGQSKIIVMRNNLTRCGVADLNQSNTKPRQLRKIAIMRDKRLSAYIQQKYLNLSKISLTLLISYSPDFEFDQRLSSTLIRK